MHLSVKSHYFIRTEKMGGGRLRYQTMLTGRILFLRSTFAGKGKVEREAKIEPPIQTEYFLSEGAIILIFMISGASAWKKYLISL